MDQAGASEAILARSNFTFRPNYKTGQAALLQVALCARASTDLERDLGACPHQDSNFAQGKIDFTDVEMVAISRILHREKWNSIDRGLQCEKQIILQILDNFAVTV